MNNVSQWTGPKNSLEDMQHRSKFTVRHTLTCCFSQIVSVASCACLSFNNLTPHSHAILQMSHSVHTIRQLFLFTDVARLLHNELVRFTSRVFHSTDSSWRSCKILKLSSRHECSRFPLCCCSRRTWAWSSAFLSFQSKQHFELCPARELFCILSFL